MGGVESKQHKQPMPPITPRDFSKHTQPMPPITPRGFPVTPRLPPSFLNVEGSHWLLGTPFRGWDSSASRDHLPRSYFDGTSCKIAGAHWLAPSVPSPLPHSSREPQIQLQILPQLITHRGKNQHRLSNGRSSAMPITTMPPLYSTRKAAIVQNSARDIVEVLPEPKLATTVPKLNLKFLDQYETVESKNTITTSNFSGRPATLQGYRKLNFDGLVLREERHQAYDKVQQWLGVAITEMSGKERNVGIKAFQLQEQGMAIVPICREKQYVDVCSSCGCPLFNAFSRGPARTLCTACGSSACPASIAASVRKCKAATLLGSGYKPEHEDTSEKNDWKAAAAKRRVEQAGRAGSIEKTFWSPTTTPPRIKPKTQEPRPRPLRIDSAASSRPSEKTLPSSTRTPIPALSTTPRDQLFDKMTTLEGITDAQIIISDPPRTHKLRKIIGSFILHRQGS